MSEVLAQLEKKGGTIDLGCEVISVTSNERINNCIVGDLYIMTFSSTGSLTITGAEKIGEFSIGSPYLECLKATATTITTSRKVMGATAFHIVNG